MASASRPQGFCDSACLHRLFAVRAVKTTVKINLELWQYGMFNCIIVIYIVGKAGTGMDREISLTLKHGAEAKDYDKVCTKII